jgi:hypothetical protein
MQFTVFDTMAQVSTLWLRNGKKIAINNYSLDTSNYYDGKIFYTKLNGSGKSKFKEEVFSVVDKSGNETIFYTPNIELGEILTPEQMKQYVSGIGDASRTKTSWLIPIGGFGVGLFGGNAINGWTEDVIDASTNRDKLVYGLAATLSLALSILYIGVIQGTVPSEEKIKEKYSISNETEY